MEKQISFGPLPRASGDYNLWEGSIQSKHEPYTLNIRGLVADRVTETGNLMTMSEAFLGPLFVAYTAVRSISNPAPELIKHGIKWRFSALQFFELSEKLAALGISFRAAAHAEGLNNALLCFLDKLFYVDTRITQHEINTDTVDDINMQALLAYMYKRNSSRRFFITDRGRFGFGRVDIREGDLVCVLLGAKDPCILRGEADHYIFVGNCFCQGLMLGEAVKGKSGGEVKLEEFVLH
jgi:hypothetical protein